MLRRRRLLRRLRPLRERESVLTDEEAGAISLNFAIYLTSLGFLCSYVDHYFRPVLNNHWRDMRTL